MIEKELPYMSLLTYVKTAIIGNGHAPRRLLAKWPR